MKLSCCDIVPDRDKALYFGQLNQAILENVVIGHSKKITAVPNKWHSRAHSCRPHVSHTRSGHFDDEGMRKTNKKN